MTAILFDATTYSNVSSSFAAGLTPARRPEPARDEMGNRIPVAAYTAADEAEYLAWVAERESALSAPSAEMPSWLMEAAMGGAGAFDLNLYA